MANIYVAQASAGANNGTSCANARAGSSLAAGDYTAGNIIHLCGTWTGLAGATQLTTLGSGTSGNPITLLFESGAQFNSPAWGSASHGAIDVAHQWITIDGGSNGIIQNTLNGDSGANCGAGVGSCTSNQVSRIINCTALCTGLTVQNLSIHNVYLHTENNTDSTDDSQVISAFNGSSNIHITQNEADHCSTGIAVATCGGSAIEIDHNTLSFYNHAITASPGSINCNIDNLKIHDNDLGGGSYVYDQVANNTYHHNPIFIFADCAGGTNQTVTNLKIYNNYIHGVFSHAGHTTGLIFLDDNGSTCKIQGWKIFNNVLEIDSGDSNGVSNGDIAQVQTSGSTGNIFVNNSIIQNNGGQGICVALYTQTNLNMQNNAITACGIPQYEFVGPLTTPTIDYNAYYNVASNGFTYPGNAFNSFATWQGQGYDAHGICTGGSNCNTSNLHMALTGSISAGSVAIGNGTNLTGLGIAELSTGAPQTFGKGGTCGNGCTPRPSSGAWDIGAYQFTGSGGTLVLGSVKNFQARFF